LLLIIVTLGAFGWWSYVAHPGTGLTAWYATVVWSLPVLTGAVGLVGAVVTAVRLRQQQHAPAADTVSELLIVVVPTIGRANTVRALERVVCSFRQCLPAHFPFLRVDIVIDEESEALDQVGALAHDSPEVRILMVPHGYRTRNGTQFKARANQYALDVRVRDGEDRADIWVLHMDDDTAVGPDTAESLARFIAGQRLATRPLHLAQGVLAYPRECGTNRLTWLADSIRPGCDISLFAATTGLGSPRSGLHGELLLVRSSIEAAIGWDFGPRSLVEDAEFALRFTERHPGRSGWFAGRSYGASPVSVADFVRQRERWVCGLLELSTKRSIPLRHRLLLLHNVVVWVASPLSHPAFILLVGYLLHDFDTSPATALLLPFWTLNVSLLAWLYWEGLKINAASSVHSRRIWWEPFALVALFPVFSLWEVTGVMRGFMQFLRKRDLEFEVIAKPV
jgi:hypothetical protein